MKAIATRPLVQGKVSAALVQHGDEGVVAEVMGNPGAVIEDATMDLAVDRFGGSETVTTAMANRAGLSARIAERLTVLVSERLREQLVARHRLGPDTAMELVLATRERATLSIAKDFSEIGVSALVSQLRRSARLTPSLILRSICVGHRLFFEHAVAQLANVPLGNVVIMMRDANGFRNAWTKAGMPAAMVPAVAAAYDAVTEIEAEGRDLTADDFSRRIVERVMTQYETFGVEFERDDLEYLFQRIGQLDSLPPA
jgi:uncharacterized protein (DUF2336 family)